MRNLVLSMINQLKLIFKKILLIFGIDIFEVYHLKVKHKQKLKIHELKQKKVYRVAFFALYAEVWKYDKLYRIMDKNPLFDPIICVCPIINYGYEHMINNINKTYNMLVERGYNVIKTYDYINDKYLDIKKEINPDIIFYTNPYRGLIDDRYYINNFFDVLTCYVPYAFMNGTQKWAYDEGLLNYAWRLFYPNEIYKKIASQLARNKGVNISVTGYPLADDFKEKANNFKDVWKIKDRKNKRIIWAPHHSITYNTNGTLEVTNSSFLSHYQLMIDIAQQYIGTIQIAFKPHPLLKSKLYDLESWGIERTNFYYEHWDSISNGQKSEGDYIDLFVSSDALIHDCGSFMIEYLYTKKPVLYISKQDMGYLSEFGRLAYDMHYKGSEYNDIVNFIEDVVVNNCDPMLDERVNFFEMHLLPPNGFSVSENIIDEIIRLINK